LFVSALLLAACGSGATDEAKVLEGTTWKLGSYVDAEGQTVDVLAGSEITARFEAGGPEPGSGTVAGSAGCNRYGGTYTASGKTLTVEVGAVTMMYCAPQAVMDQEAAYLVALQQAASYEITDGQLVVQDGAGKTVLTFSELQPKPLAGTPWALAWYDNVKGGLVSNIAGTEITALFGGDGKLAGSAGCNNYTTAYKLDGDKITVDLPASTRMACAEPQGIMEQESAYLAALATAATYQIEGDELRLLNADGRKAAVFGARPPAATFAREVLQNAEYQTDWLPEGTVRLANGEYRAAAAPGSASEIVIALTEQIATGELDGQLAAAVILTSSGGGSGTFYELHVLDEQDGQPHDVAWTQLGDRVQINALSIQNGEIVVDLVTHGPDDPMCCPTKQVVQTYALQGEELVQTSQ